MEVRGQLLGAKFSPSMRVLRSQVGSSGSVTDAKPHHQPTELPLLKSHTGCNSSTLSSFSVLAPPGPFVFLALCSR